MDSKRDCHTGEATHIQERHGICLDCQSNLNLYQRRKRLDGRHSVSPPNKRQKSDQYTITTMSMNTEEDGHSDAGGVPDCTPDDDSRVIKRFVEVAKLKDLYYPSAFKMIGQLGCRDIAKAWIRKCHPKKQTSNPYNGKGTKDQSESLHGFKGALTVPDYWPSQEGWKGGRGCRHIEPDHLFRHGL